MPKDKFTATWVSHSSISDFLRCPKAYYLRHVYKDPLSGKKITHMQPPLALGQAVHEVVESLSVLPMEQRLTIPLSKKFDVAWQKVSGEKGGFSSRTQEMEFKERGLMMLSRVENNPGLLLKKAIKLKQDLPYYWISEEENIILSGKIDWLSYVEEEDSVHIVDFKTGKNEEAEDSLQLPIYLLLARNIQTRPVHGVSYWYLDRDDEPTAQELPDENDARRRVMDVAKRIKLARQIERFVCPTDGCYACRDLERIINGEGRKVGTSQYGQEIYILPDVA